MRAAAIRFIQERSARELAVRRAEVVAAIQSALAQRGAPGLEFVNGGGTGSVEGTTGEDAVTEVAAGSGLYGPTLFDAYTRFQPRAAALVDDQFGERGNVADRDVESLAGDRVDDMRGLADQR